MGCVITIKKSPQISVKYLKDLEMQKLKAELSQQDITNRKPPILQENHNPNFSHRSSILQDKKKDLYSKKQSLKVDYSLTAQKVKEIKSLAEGEQIIITRKITQNVSSVQKDYNILAKIGKGSFGSVFKVHHKKTGHFRAMKVIKKETINLQDDDRTFLKEIEILIKADHPNIIKIYEYFIDEVNYYLIMEFVSGGELYDTITSWKSFNEKKAAYIMKQILSAVAYLHSYNIIHRDLKPENMLVENKHKNKSGEEEINIKIIDFGTCNYVDKNSKLTLKVGSPYYIAPEVLKREYGKECDIWSCGVILYVLLVGYPPFSGKSTEDLFNKITKGNYSLEGIYWSNISKEAKTLVMQMLDTNPKRRITAEKALASKWITENSTSAMTNKDYKYFENVLTNIKNWDAGEKFQQATLAYIVHFIYPTNEIEELKKVFKTIDKNGDGKLTYDELSKCFELVFGKEISHLEIGKIIGEIDGDADGYISYEEFLRVSINKSKLLDEANLKLAFDSFDLNKDGKLSQEEIKKVLGTNKNDYVDYLINAIDQDNNNEIDFNEFKELMVSLLQKKLNSSNSQKCLANENKDNQQENTTCKDNHGIKTNEEVDLNKSKDKKLNESSYSFNSEHNSV